MNAIEHVDIGAPSSFVWDYAARQPRIAKLYEKSKVSQWNAARDIDWSIDVDPGYVSPDLRSRFAAANFDFHSSAVGAFASASEENRWLVDAHSHAWTVSQFLHGEQGALVATARICAGVESIDDKCYAAALVADEARHVAFGVVSLQGFYDEMDPVDRREREDFVLGACALMHDRFVPAEVYEHLGIDVSQASAQFELSPEMALFRSLMFSKVVPTLGKLGLLTPRVREGFERLGILRYEHYLDSATEAGELEARDVVGPSGHRGHNSRRDSEDERGHLERHRRWAPHRARRRDGRAHHRRRRRDESAGPGGLAMTW